MSNTSKETLRAEIAKLCADQGKALPEGLDELKQLALFDALEALTGVKDPRRPAGPPAGAVRASSPSAPPPASEPPASEPPASEPPASGDESSDDESSDDESSDESPEPEPAPATAAPAADKATRFRVANGRMVVCVPGRIGAFQEIRAIDLSGGQEELEALLAAGTVEPAKR